MAITRSIASSNLLNAVQKKNADGPVEKKMATRTGLQRAALGNISNKATLLNKADAQKGLKDKKVADKVAVKKSTTVLSSSNVHHQTVKHGQQVEPVFPVAPTASSSVSMAPVVPVEEVAVCEVKKLAPRQEPIIEVEESTASDESIIEIDVSSNSVSMDTSGQSEAMTKEEAFSNRMSALMLRDIDEDGDNPQLVSEYAKDIYHYMMDLETQMAIRQNHLSKQSEVNAGMRCILVDWLIQVQQWYHLLQETLFLTVAILDRYLQIEHVAKTKLQLVGVASMWIAAKYEEIYAPEVADFAYITDHAYTKAQIRSMECTILRALDFSFGGPLPIHFLRRFSKAGDGPLMVFYTSYDEATLTPLMSKLAQIAMNAGSGKTTAVKTKYQSSKLMKVSVLDELKSDQLREVASLPTTPVFPFSIADSK